MSFTHAGYYLIIAASVAVVVGAAGAEEVLVEVGLVGADFTASGVDASAFVAEGVAVSVLVLVSVAVADPDAAGELEVGVAFAFVSPSRWRLWPSSSSQLEGS